MGWSKNNIAEYIIVPLKGDAMQKSKINYHFVWKFWNSELFELKLIEILKYELLWLHNWFYQNCDNLNFGSTFMDIQTTEFHYM